MNGNDNFKDVWHQSEATELLNVRQTEREAARIARRLASWRALAYATLAGLLAFGIYVVATAASAIDAVLLSTPWFAIAAACAHAMARRRQLAQDMGTATVEFLRYELTLARDEARQLAGWRGFVAVLGAMWLVIAGHVLSDGVGVAFAARGASAGLAIAIAVPLVSSTVIFLIWRVFLKRAASRREEELEHLAAWAAQD